MELSHRKNVKSFKHWIASARTRVLLTSKLSERSDRAGRNRRSRTWDGHGSRGESELLCICELYVLYHIHSRARAHSMPTPIRKVRSETKGGDSTHQSGPVPVELFDVPLDNLMKGSPALNGLHQTPLVIQPHSPVGGAQGVGAHSSAAAPSTGISYPLPAPFSSSSSSSSSCTSSRTSVPTSLSASSSCISLSEAQPVPPPHSESSSQSLISPSKSFVSNNALTHMGRDERVERALDSVAITFRTQHMKYGSKPIVLSYDQARWNRSCPANIDWMDFMLGARTATGRIVTYKKVAVDVNDRDQDDVLRRCNKVAYQLVAHCHFLSRTHSECKSVVEWYTDWCTQVKAWRDSRTWTTLVDGAVDLAEWEKAWAEWYPDTVEHLVDVMLPPSFNSLIRGTPALFSSVAIPPFTGASRGSHDAMNGVLTLNSWLTGALCHVAAWESWLLFSMAPSLHNVIVTPPHVFGCSTWSHMVLPFSDPGFYRFTAWPMNELEKVKVHENTFRSILELDATDNVQLDRYSKPFRYIVEGGNWDVSRQRRLITYAPLSNQCEWAGDSYEVHAGQCIIVPPGCCHAFRQCRIGADRMSNGKLRKEKIDFDRCMWSTPMVAMTSESIVYGPDFHSCMLTLHDWTHFVLKSRVRMGKGPCSTGKWDVFGMEFVIAMATIQSSLCHPWVSSFISLMDFDRTNSAADRRATDPSCTPGTSLLTSSLRTESPDGPPRSISTGSSSPSSASASPVPGSDSTASGCNSELSECAELCRMSTFDGMFLQEPMQYVSSVQLHQLAAFTVYMRSFIRSVEQPAYNYLVTEHRSPQQAQLMPNVACVVLAGQCDQCSLIIANMFVTTSQGEFCARCVLDAYRQPRGRCSTQIRCMWREMVNGIICFRVAKLQDAVRTLDALYNASKHYLDAYQISISGHRLDFC